MATTLNRKGERWARNAIKRGAFDATSAWSFDAAAQDALLGDPPKWGIYANCFLGTDAAAEANSKGRFKYPHARKSGGSVKVYRSALRAIRLRSAQQEEMEIHAAAGRLLDAIDAKQGRSTEQRRAYFGPSDGRPGESHGADLRFRIPAVELRADGDGDDTVLTGYAAVFDVLSEPMWWGAEKIARGAFARSIKSGADVIANLEHEGGLNVLGRRSNKTLDLAEDDHGLKVTIRPPDTQTGRDAVLLVREGFLTQMSFAFRVVKQQLDESGDDLLRTLMDVDLYDVAVVSMPAYPQTNVEAKGIRTFDMSWFDGRIRVLELETAAR